jgi:serine/threonine protein kinase/Tol biopolymer transport system component
MIGEILGHYRVLEKIGSGGMGEVYRARDDRLARDVAIKVLKPSFAHDPDRLRRFELEARSAAALSHPNIVSIYDIGMHNGAPYIVSELLHGQTLRQRLAQGVLSPRQTADYGMQIAEGLVAAYEKRIIHRDLKPENLFITRDGHLKILDFGIAKLARPEAGEDHSIETMATQTKAGSVLGTVRYMSPEQLRGKAVDHRTDIFSLGAILYEMLTKNRAFAGETDVDTMMAVLQQEPPEMALSGQNVPPAFEQIVHHCLEKDPENRFQTARDLAFALSTLSDVSGRQFVPAKLRKNRFNKWLPWIAAVVVVAAAGILLGTYLKPTVSPIYRRITFERGTVYSARFSPDSHSILYGAAWNGRPLEIYTTVGDSPLARSLGFASADMLALSRTNELALLLHGTPDRRNFTRGVLARAPLAGGTPREILEDAPDADWSPQGNLAVVHYADGRSRLEYPIGKVLYQTAGWISDIRFSPQGDRIAFLDHPAAWDDRGSVCVVNLTGQKATLATGWDTENGLAWTPAGDQIWFTAAESGSTDRSLWAVDLHGNKRKVLTIPGGLTLQDIAPDGRVLLTVDTERVAMEWTGKNSKEGKDLSWYDWSIAKDISSDGQSILFEESSEPAGQNYAVAIRKLDGSPPIRLGEGTVGSLSPDGKWALAIYPSSPQHISLYPIGPGQAREIFVPELAHLENGGAHFLPDGKRIVLNGNLPGRPVRTFLLDLSGGKPQAVTPEGQTASLSSPDGRYLVGREGDRLALFPVNGGPRILVPTHKPGTPYDVANWSADSKALYVYCCAQVPQKIYRLDIASGNLTFLRELTPTDRAGVIRISPVVTDTHASEFAYSYFQTLSVLYVVSGLH